MVAYLLLGCFWACLVVDFAVVFVLQPFCFGCFGFGSLCVFCGLFGF